MNSGLNYLWLSKTAQICVFKKQNERTIFALFRSADIQCFIKFYFEESEKNNVFVLD
jgi:hypothetical protein